MNETIFSIKHVTKRNGEVTEFNTTKILNAINKAGNSTGEFNEDVAHMLCLKTINLIQQLYLINSFKT